MRAEHVALPGDHAQRGVGADQFPRLGQVGGHDDAGQQAGQRGRQPVRGPDQREGGLGTVRERDAGREPAVRGRRRVTRRPGRDHQAGAARVLVLERLQDGHGRVEAGDGDRVRRVAQRRRDGFLGPGVHAHQGRDPAQHPGVLLRVGQQRPGGVLAGAQRVHALAERLDPGLQRGPLGTGLTLGRAPVGDQRGRFLQLGGGPLVLPGQPGPVVVPARAQFLQLLVLLLSLLGAGAGLLDRVGQPPGFLLRRGCLAARGSDLGPQPGQALGPHGLRAGTGREPPLLVGERGFRGGALGGGGGELFPRRLQPLAEDRFLLPEGLRLQLQFLRVAARARRVGLGHQVAVPLLGQAGHAAEAFGESGQREPGFLRGGEPGSVLLLVVVELSFPLARLGQDALQFRAAGQRGRLVGLVTLQPGGRGHVVVGEQPQPGVAQVGLDDGGPAGDGRLAAERLEAALQLCGQVHQPGQVGLHRLELAQRLFLAAAVLQHSGRFLDQGPPGLGSRVEYLVELALADDHVHLAAEAGVGQEFLDVEEAAVVAVDRVLALPGPEEQAADRHLGVLDGEGAVAVVDRERDFGAAQRGARGGPGEDHVLHLAAAQVLHPLLAHHPGERVHHVGLA